ncbi:1776_t:CDS:2, partial [Entrophospora sp. SA101]
KQRLVINIKDIMEFNPQTGTIKGNWVEAINRLANLTDSRLEKNKIKNMLESTVSPVIGCAALDDSDTHACITRL